MRTLTIEQINELEHGEVVPRFVGTIQKVFDQKTGEGQYGTWWLQNFIVSAAGQEITATWTGEDTMNGWEGKTVEFSCGEGKQGKPAGITRDIRQVGEKTYKGVKITPQAKLARIEGGTSEGGTQSKPQEASAQAPQTPPARSNGERLEECAKYAARVFAVNWELAAKWIGTLPQKDLEELSVYEYYDLQMRHAQHGAIETGKIIRKERF